MSFIGELGNWLKSGVNDVEGAVGIKQPTPTAPVQTPPPPTTTTAPATPQLTVKPINAPQTIQSFKLPTKVASAPTLMVKNTLSRNSIRTPSNLSVNQLAPSPHIQQFKLPTQSSGSELKLNAKPVGRPPIPHNPNITQVTREMGVQPNLAKPLKNGLGSIKIKAPKRLQVGVAQTPKLTVPQAPQLAVKPINNTQNIAPNTPINYAVPSNQDIYNTLKSKNFWKMPADAQVHYIDQGIKAGMLDPTKMGPIVQKILTKAPVQPNLDFMQGLGQKIVGVPQGMWKGLLHSPIVHNLENVYHLATGNATPLIESSKSFGNQMVGPITPIVNRTKTGYPVGISPSGNQLLNQIGYLTMGVGEGEPREGSDLNIPSDNSKSEPLNLNEDMFTPENIAKYEDQIKQDELANRQKVVDLINEGGLVGGKPISPTELNTEAIPPIPPEQFTVDPNFSPWEVDQLPVDPIDSPTHEPVKESKLIKGYRQDVRLQKLGPEGQEFLQGAHAYDYRWKRIFNKIRDASGIDQVSPTLLRHAWEVREGVATTTDPEIQALADQLGKIEDYNRMGLNSTGEKIPFRKGYMPHLFPDSRFTSSAIYNKIIQGMIDSGEAPDAESAMELLNQYRHEASQTRGTFERPREFNTQGYLKTKEALLAHYESVAKRLARNQQFGPNDEVLTDLYNRAGLHGNDAETLKTIMNDKLNPPTPDTGLVSTIGTGINKVVNAIYLKTAVINHITQAFSNAGSELGFGNYFKGLGDRLLSPEDNAYNAEIGMRDTQLKPLEQSFISKGINKITAVFLSHVYQFGREVTSIMMKNASEKWAQDGDLAKLQKWGLTGPIEYNPDGSIKLSLTQQGLLSHNFTNSTMFSHDSLESGAFLRDGGFLSKSVGTFRKSYIFKQSGKIVSFLQRAAHGDIMPAVRYFSVAVPVTGIVVASGKNLVSSGRPIKKGQSVGNFAMQALGDSGVGAIGMGAGNAILSNLQYDYNPDSTWQNVVGSISPLAGIGVQTGQDIVQALEGNTKPGEKQLISMLPAGATTIEQNLGLILPPKAQANLTNYYNQVSTLSNSFADPKSINPNAPNMGPGEMQRELTLFKDAHTPSQPIDGVTYSTAYDPNANATKFDQYTTLVNNQPALNTYFYAQQKLLNSTPGYPVDPLYKLNGTGTDANGQTAPKALVALEYNAKPDGDPQKTSMLQANGGVNGWLSQYEQDRFSYSQNYKTNIDSYMKSVGYSSKAINQYWQSHPSNPDPLQMPVFDKQTTNVLNTYDKLLNNPNDPYHINASKYFTQNSVVLSNTLATIAKHTNAMRIATGNEPLQNYPSESPHVTQVLNSLPTGTDPATKAYIARVIKANPDVEEYLAKTELSNVTKTLSQNMTVNPSNPTLNEGNLLNVEPSGQKAMKDLVDLGKYGIGTNSTTVGGKASTPPSSNIPQGSTTILGKTTFTSPIPNATNLIVKYANQYGVDPKAALSVSAMEGLSGNVGDNGTSFGPFQLHAGGALPESVWARGPQYAQAWANSPAGIQYAIQTMASVAKGLTGQSAVESIVNSFERPLNPTNEINGAMEYYTGSKNYIAPPNTGGGIGYQFIGGGGGTGTFSPGYFAAGTIQPRWFFGYPHEKDYAVKARSSYKHYKVGGGKTAPDHKFKGTKVGVKKTNPKRFKVAPNRPKGKPVMFKVGNTKNTTGVKFKKRELALAK